MKIAPPFGLYRIEASKSVHLIMNKLIHISGSADTILFAQKLWRNNSPWFKSSAGRINLYHENQDSVRLDTYRSSTFGKPALSS
jgi:hypothetical protein